MCGIRSREGRETGKKLTSNIDFFSFFDNRQKFFKRRRCVQKKVGFTDLFKPQNPGEIAVLAKSAIFAYKSSFVRALDE